MLSIPHQFIQNTKKPKFKPGDMVRYLMRKGKFSKESSLTGSWSEKIFQIHKVRNAHEFNPIHIYVLSELCNETPQEELPPVREDHLKNAFISKTDTFEIERILDAKRNKVLIKWVGYEVPTWEPRSSILKKWLPRDPSAKLKKV